MHEVDAMEPGTHSDGEVWWVAALYFASNSMLALGPAVTSEVGLRLAAVFAAGALLFVLAGWTSESRATAALAV